MVGGHLMLSTQRMIYQRVGEQKNVLENMLSKVTIYAHLRLARSVRNVDGPYCDLEC